MNKILMRVFAVSLVFCGFAGAEELSAELTADFYGKYVWRGQNLDNEPVFQPGLSLSYGNLTGSVWGSLEMTDQNGSSGDFTEVDYSLDYSDAVPGVECLSYSAGVVYYDFPGTDVPATTELYFGLSVEMPLNPSLTYYQDVDEADGAYLAFGLGHSIDCIGEFEGMEVGLDISASVGWGSKDYTDYYWGVSGDKMQDLSLSLALPMTAGNWTISPSINYVTVLSDSLRESDAYSSDSDYVFAGIGFSRSF